MKPIVALTMALSGSTAGVARIEAQSIASGPGASRIESLRVALAGGDSTAERQFWNEVAQRGTPIIEAATHSDSAAVTFVVRAPATARVTLLSMANVLRTPPGVVPTEGRIAEWGRMTLVPGSSSVWYLTMIVPRDLRVGYGFRVDTIAASTTQRGMGIGQGDILDPLNSKRWLQDVPAFRASVLELSKAPAQPWRDAGVPSGTWKKHSLKSKTTGDERPFWVYLPAGFDPKSKSSLFIGMSSGTFSSAIPIDVIVDHLAKGNGLRVPVSVVVDELPGDDTTRYRATTSFLADELVPWLRATYGVSSRPRDVIIGGSSRRGVISTIAAFTRPDVFGNVLSMSGGFSWRPAGEQEFEWTTHMIAASPRRQVRFYLSAGKLEVGVTSRNLGHYLLATNRHLRDVLQARGYEVAYREFSSVHSELNWQDQLYDGLLVLLNGTRASSR